MKRSAVGDMWLDLYDTVALLQATCSELNTFEEDQALESIVYALDRKDPKWHDALMQDMLENLSPEQLTDLLENLTDDDEDED